VHVHSSMAVTAELYGRGVPGSPRNDVLFSAAKLAFAYAWATRRLSPSPSSTAVLMAERATRLRYSSACRKKAHDFHAVPTL